MNMSDWAKKEVEIFTEKNEDECGFNYVGECAKSALKAFESLMNDGHSGMSIGITKNILNKLIDGIALTPIEDTPDVWGMPSKLNDDNKIIYQCKRMSSLFKKIYDDGTVKYSDVGRCVGIALNNPVRTYTSGRIYEIVDEFFPITMPYSPKGKRYEVYTDDFLYDQDNGDFDCEAFYYMITPEGDKVELNRFYHYPKHGNTIKLTKEEYENMKAKQVK